MRHIFMAGIFSSESVSASGTVTGYDGLLEPILPNPLSWAFGEIDFGVKPPFHPSSVFI